MKMFLSIALGAAVGFALYYLGACSTGTCPLTGNPVISTLIGALVGFLAVAKRKKK